MGKFGKAVLAAVVVGAVTLLSGGTLTAAAIAAGLSLVSSTILAPKMAGAEPRQAAETSLQLGEHPRQALFGEAATAGSLLDAFNYGGEYGTDWEVLLIALADHECEALVGFNVNDERYTFTGNGDVSGFNGQLSVHFMPGTESQQWPSWVTGNAAGWGGDSNAKGIACVAVRYKADKPDAKNPVWTAGRPTFLWVVKGKKCYQARKDDTVPGGSGSHRYDDPATWEWTDNAADCRYQYQRGIFALDRIDEPDQLLLGRGLSAMEAPPERCIAYANTCDELVPLDAGGTEKRYTFNGLIGADEDFLTAESYFAETMGGIIIQPEGGIEVEPGAPKPVAAEITDLDILNLSEVQFDHFRGEADAEWVNTVTARFVSEAQGWKMHSAPIRREYADVIADGGPRVSQPDLKHVTRVGQAQRIGEIKRRLGRLTKTGSIPLGPRFAYLEEGDWIGWTSDRHFNGARFVFRIDSYSRDIKWHHKLQLREIDASVYGWQPTDERADTTVAEQQAPPPAIAAPDANAWTATGSQISGARGDQPALLLSGASDNSYSQATRIEYRRTGETEWQSWGEFPPDSAPAPITGVADETEYEVAVSYVVDGEPGARRVLPPVTAGTLQAASAARRIESSDVTFPLTSDDTSISIAAASGVLSDGSSFAFPAATLTGLDQRHSLHRVPRPDRAGILRRTIACECTGGQPRTGRRRQAEHQ